LEVVVVDKSLAVVAMEMAMVVAITVVQAEGDSVSSFA
jgi:hypothetical protein